MSSRVTPGPWVARDADIPNNVATVGYCGSWVFGPDHASPHQVSYDDHGHEEADARLCAAAPEMLAALKSCLPNLELFKLHAPDVRAAIAKATGVA